MDSRQSSGQPYDVIVVGAGPAGSYLAERLGALGYHIAVFEQKTSSEANVCCTGIISTECLRSLGLGPDVILREIKSARFFSPSGKCLRLQTRGVQAYVVNRVLLDKSMAAKAQSHGASYFYSSPVTDIIPGKDRIQVEVSRAGNKERISGRALVLASGFRPRLPWKLGLGKISRFLIGVQAEVEAKDVEELEIYLDPKISPGSFAWLVPTVPGKAYAGLLTTSQAKPRLRNLLTGLSEQGRIGSAQVKIEQRAIPIGTLARTYRDRLLVIGDAAGHVKPTTGGGIYFGNLGAQIATKVLDHALRTDNLVASFLSRYEKEWKMKMGRELSSGYWARRIYAQLSDHQIDRIFDVLNSNGVVAALLNSDDFSFDWHSRLVLAALRRSSLYPWLRIRQHLTREASL